MIVRSGKGKFPAGAYGPFELLSNLEPGIILDIGASNGATAKKAIRFSPQSVCHAFEPFEGNWPHFERAVGDDERIILHKMAVADASRKMPFFVHHVVKTEEGRWSNMQGYSSVGKLLLEEDNPNLAQAKQIKTCAIDDLFTTERILFIKIDVQGGEELVLRGGAKALSESRVDVMFIEFSGQEKVLEHLSKFEIYDYQYLLVPKNEEINPKEDWDLFNERKLSTGRRAWSGWPKDHPSGDYAEWLQEQRRCVGYIQTDLVCIRPEISNLFFGKNL